MPYLRTYGIGAALLVVLVYSLLLVTDWDRTGQPVFPLLPKAVTETRAGSDLAWYMAGVASDQWLYYAESDYLLRGRVDPRFRAYKMSAMDGRDLVPGAGSRVRLPYRDLTFEYPPLAAVFVLLPGVFAETLYDYKILFSLMAAAFLLGTAWIGCRMGERLVAGNGSALAAASLAFFACFGPLLISRLDVFAVFFVAAAFLSLQEKKPAWSGVCLALGVAAKLYPAVFLPFFLVFVWRAESPKAALRLGAAFLATLALIYAPVLIVAAGGYLDSLRYHSDRGVELESVWASWAQIRHLFGEPASTYLKHGSINVSWAGEAWVKRWWIAAAFAAIAPAGLRFLRKRTPEVPDLVRACLAALVGLLITSKVLSAQYLLWLYPLLFWTPARRRFAVSLGLAAAFITQMIFPYFFNELTALDPGAIGLLAARNVVLILLFLVLQ